MHATARLGGPTALLAVVLPPPPVMPQWLQAGQLHPARLTPNADTGRGTAKALTADAQPPVGDYAPWAAPERKPLAVNDDTSLSVPAPLAATVPPAPFVPTVWIASHRHPAGLSPLPEASRGTPKPLTLDGQVVAVFLRAPEEFPLWQPPLRAIQ